MSLSMLPNLPDHRSKSALTITSFCSVLLFGAIFQLNKALDAILIHYFCSCPKNVILVLSSFPRASIPFFSHLNFIIIIFFLLGVDSWSSVERERCVRSPCQPVPGLLIIYTSCQVYILPISSLYLWGLTLALFFNLL